MTKKCIHGIDIRFCKNCQEAIEREPILADAVWSTQEGEGVLILRPAKAGRVKVLTEAGISEMEEITLQSEAGSGREGLLRDLLAKTASERGFLFVPESPLTRREQLDDIGPTHCYHCKSTLSFETGSLGCSKCQYYVCGCGRCLCGYEGWNWKGEPFSQFPPLPISWEDRLEYLRAFRYLISA